MLSTLFRRSPPPFANESVTLGDGRVVTLMPLTPEAKPMIAEAITRVSPESSRRRFFTVRRRFSELELDQLTRLDGWRRFAIGACAGKVGAAAARFARSAEDPVSAEIALLVVDDFQHAGLGRLMLERLVESARERGIERITGLVLRDNEPMIQLLRHYAPGLAVNDAGDHLAVEVPIRRRWWWGRQAA